jgi:putative methionine-R-sulfoxide reductase with GAF domain
MMLNVCVRALSGVCGRAVLTSSVQLVGDVHNCEYHIACDPNSNSEVVIPIVCNSEIVGVFDLDSPSRGWFDSEDVAGLSALVQMLADSSDWANVNQMANILAKEGEELVCSATHAKPKRTAEH